MSDEVIATKEALLAAIDEAWPRLNESLDRLATEDFTAHQDAEGWTVKDHVVHLAAWERSVVFLLGGRPRHAGLGVSEPLYLSGGEDAINRAVTQANKHISVASALEQLRTVHGEMMVRLASLDDAALQRRYRFYLPDEPGEGDGPPVLGVIYSNTANHYAEHLPWIEAIVASEA